ncbi:MAG: tRNA uridine-5-carboxymethylaminomethyl(34) synthesis GTPase MnmE [Porticoccaceae bacterium]
MATDVDTIAAVATAPGRGGVGVVRISGASLDRLLPDLCDRPIEPRRVVHCRFLDQDGSAIDAGIALYFRAPASFTGEDVIELQGHGGPVVMDMLLRRVLALGARLARPGEFSERAFLNGKIDLVQAEAVADLIAADSEAAARGAMRSLQGEFSKRLQALTDDLVSLRVRVEAALDFPDEEIGETAGVDSLFDRLDTLLKAFESLRASVRQGVVLRDGIRVAIAGRPNAGKSRLLNALSGQDTAIVTELPGTTRDVLRETIHLEGIPVRMVDTAGLRASNDQIEAEGIRRARGEIERADCVLLVIDSARERGAGDVDALIAEEFAACAQNGRLTLVLNKADLSGLPVGKVEGPIPTLVVSASTGAGLDALRGHLISRARGDNVSTAEFSGRRRHLVALDAAEDHVKRARTSARAQGLELLAEELRQAQRELGTISGAFSTEDLLGEIFGAFCIGK